MPRLAPVTIAVFPSNLVLTEWVPFHRDSATVIVQHMQPPTLVDAGQVTLAYETFGSPDSPPLVLVMGVASQMIVWPDEFCQALADDGFYVIRFDNRDIGLSTHLDDAGVPDLVALLSGTSTSSPYTLADMADDTAGLLDAL